MMSVWKRRKGGLKKKKRIKCMDSPVSVIQSQRSYNLFISSKSRHSTLAPLNCVFGYVIRCYKKQFTRCSFQNNDLVIHDEHLFCLQCPTPHRFLCVRKVIYSHLFFIVYSNYIHNSIAITAKIKVNIEGIVHMGPK